MITARLEHADGHEITPRDWIHLREIPFPGDVLIFAGNEHAYRVLTRRFHEIPYQPDGMTLDVTLRVRQETL